MKEFSRYLPLWLLPPLMCLFVMSAAPLAAAAVIRTTWIEHRGEVFTIHVRMSGRPRWQLSAQANQLLIDLNADANWPSNQFLHAAVGPLGTVRLIAAPGGRVRMLIDVTGNCDYVVGRRHDQLIVSLARRGAAANLAEAFAAARPPTRGPERRPRPAVMAAPVQPVRRQPLARNDHTADRPPVPVTFAAPAQGRQVVVVDPGHGGHDPGTHSADGIVEKDLALQIGRRLADTLSRHGVKPVLTRDRDVYLSLAQRTAIANQARADLFVSIHLNWSPNPRTTGIEVYYLNNTTDRATIRLARMENAADPAGVPADPNLHYILSDLQQQYKATESALLAQVMEQQTVDALKGGFGNDIHGLGAKRGPFYVLVGPELPAVLVECGFLSNPAETQRLATPAYQQRLADGLATAVVDYLNQDVSAGTL
jgi:N-acetylmuramoyl-L-alanine amidase